jgi:hypothetical protein
LESESDRLVVPNDSVVLFSRKAGVALICLLNSLLKVTAQ